MSIEGLERFTAKLGRLEDVDIRIPTSKAIALVQEAAKSSVRVRTSELAVLSYVNEKAREAEKDNTMAQPYMKAVTYETDYDSAMTDRKAYAYLKTLPIFEGAKDIVDEADTDISGDDFLAMVEEVM